MTSPPGEPGAAPRARLAACLLLALVGACGGGEEEAPSTGPAPVRVGIAIPSYVHAVAWIADEEGRFAAHGLDAEIQVMGGSAATMRALLAEGVDVGIAGGDALLLARAAGADLVVVAGLVDRFYHRLVARRGIDTAEALRGKRVGLPFLGGPQDLAVRQALTTLGLTYGEDVEILNLGRELNRMAALSRGDIDATTSQTPPGRLRELGLEVLVDLPALDVHFPYAVVAVRRAFLRDHPERVEGALRALCDAAVFYRAHRDASLRIIAARTSGSDTAAAQVERYETSGPSLIRMPPRPTAEGFETARRLLDDPRLADVSVDAFFELSILERLIAEGACPAP